jgi:glyoxylate utilization-related uncharacterized protein
MSQLVDINDIFYNEKEYSVCKIDNILFIIDKECKNIVNNKLVRVNPDKYIYLNSNSLHRIIMDAVSNDLLSIDHINRIKTDNRKENLKFATSS